MMPYLHVHVCANSPGHSQWQQREKFWVFSSSPTTWNGCAVAWWINAAAVVRSTLPQTQTRVAQKIQNLSKRTGARNSMITAVPAWHTQTNSYMYTGCRCCRNDLIYSGSHGNPLRSVLNEHSPCEGHWGKFDSAQTVRCIIHLIAARRYAVHVRRTKYCLSHNNGTLQNRAMFWFTFHVCEFQQWLKILRCVYVYFGKCRFCTSRVVNFEGCFGWV